jgi:Phytoene dehydrogenase and related proteins
LNKPSIIVIGAGMAGLTCAAYLAKAGLAVQVFEQHTRPGGYISSFNRKGFTFPAGPTSFGSNGIIFPILRELGLENSIRFARAGHQISWAEKDIPLTNPQQTESELAQIFPQEQANLRRYFRWVKIGGEGLQDLMASGVMFGRHAGRSAFGTLLRHPLFPWAVGKARNQTNRSLHQNYFSDRRLIAMLNQLGYPVMSGQNTLGMWISYFDDTWVPEGGMQSMADGLAQCVQAHGGEIHLRQSVRRIRLEGQRACGVELEDGTGVSGDWVISAADLMHTCLNLIGQEHLGAGMPAKLAAALPSESAFSVYLGLRGSPQLSAGLERFRNSHVSYSGKDGRPIHLVLLSKDDPSLAPAGGHALSLGYLSPYTEWENLKDDPAGYRAEKTRRTDALLKQVEEFIPGLGAHVEVHESATPLTCERYTGNWRGSTAGWCWDPQTVQHFDWQRDIPVEHFRAIGHYIFNPGGVPTAMITAWYIAQEIIKGVA